MFCSLTKKNFGAEGASTRLCWHDAATCQTAGRFRARPVSLTEHRAWSQQRHVFQIQLDAFVSRISLKHCLSINPNNKIVLIQIWQKEECHSNDFRSRNVLLSHSCKLSSNPSPAMRKDNFKRVTLLTIQTPKFANALSSQELKTPAKSLPCRNVITIPVIIYLQRKHVNHAERTVPDTSGRIRCFLRRRH